MAKTTILNQANTLTRAINFASLVPVQKVSESDQALIYADLAFAQAHASRKAINKAKPLRFVCDNEAISERFYSKVFYTDIVGQILETYLFGLNVFELNWNYKDGYYFPELKQRDFRDFAFTEDGELGFAAFGGVPLPIPAGKVVYALHEPNYAMPYGDALLPKLLKIIQLKNATTSFWAKFQEKFGSPWAVAKTDSAPEELAAEVHSMLAGDTAVIDTEEEISLIQPSSKTGDFKELLGFLDNAIRSVILGGNLSSEVEGGSFAAASVHEGVRQDIAAADLANLLFIANKTCEHFKRVNNYSGELYCELESEAEPKMELAQRDAVIAGMGFDLSAEYIAETYGVEVTKKEQSAGWGYNSTESANNTFKEELNANKTSIKHDEIDEALESEEFAKLAEEINETYAQHFAKSLESAKDYDEALKAISETEFSNEALDEYIAAALQNSVIKGASSE